MQLTIIICRNATEREKNQISNLTAYKINIAKSTTLLYTSNALAEKEIRKPIPFILALKTKIPRNQSNQGGKRLLQ